MQDPRLMAQWEQERPENWRRQYLARDPSKLNADLVALSDKIVWATVQLHDARDELARTKKELADTKEQLRAAKTKIWILSLIVSPVVSMVLTALVRLAIVK